MRIDVFLRTSGLLKTRTLAGKACGGGYAVLNGRPSRASAEVRPGDVVDLTLPDGRVCRFEILEVPSTKQVSRADRKSLYRILEGDVSAGDV
jgi:ribosomal 50S subunit-recycling heat shock protein